MERIADRLREARLNAGFASADEFAERIGVAPEVYRAYEDGTRYMSPQLGYRMAQVLGVGWVDLLYGPEYTDDYADYGWQGATVRRRQAPQEAVSYVGGGVDVIERPRTATRTSASRSLAARTRSRSDYLPELEQARAQLLDAPPPLRNVPAARQPREVRETRGLAGDAVTFDELDTPLASGAGLDRASENPLGGWSVPREVIKIGSRSAGANLKMLTILGDEMEPTFRMNDRILVDTSDTRPSPAGVFVVWDGMSLVVRRIEMLAGSEPVRLRVSTDSPKYQPVERLHAETLIQGRVIARWSWI
jgi:phage repressor protein C with HTH and peptisase S24 domain